jgi:hypothetical protein
MGKWRNKAGKEVERGQDTERGRRRKNEEEEGKRNKTKRRRTI